MSQVSIQIGILCVLALRYRSETPLWTNNVFLHQTHEVYSNVESRSPSVTDHLSTTHYYTLCSLYYRSSFRQKKFIISSAQPLFIQFLHLWNTFSDCICYLSGLTETHLFCWPVAPLIDHGIDLWSVLEKHLFQWKTTCWKLYLD